MITNCHSADAAANLSRQSHFQTAGGQKFAGKANGLFVVALKRNGEYPQNI